jgi:hypothetical protein
VWRQVRRCGPVSRRHHQQRSRRHLAPENGHQRVKRLRENTGKRTVNALFQAPLPEGAVFWRFNWRSIADCSRQMQLQTQQARQHDFGRGTCSCRCVCDDKTQAGSNGV